jgi:hypothetical protein
MQQLPRPALLIPLHRSTRRARQAIPTDTLELALDRTVANP